MSNRKQNSRNAWALPAVISGLTGLQEGPNLDYNRGEAVTLDQWFGPAVSDFVDKRNQQQTFQFVQEMFEGRVDDEIVRMVLDECDWKEEEAIEQLLELSKAEEGSVAANEESKKKNTLKAIARTLLADVGPAVSAPLPSPPVQRDLTSVSPVKFSKEKVVYNHNGIVKQTGPAYHSSTPQPFAAVLKLNSTKNVCNCDIQIRETQVPTTLISRFTEASVAAGPIPFTGCFTDHRYSMAVRNDLTQVNQTDTMDSLDWIDEKNEIYFSDEETCDDHFGYDFQLPSGTLQMPDSSISNPSKPNLFPSFNVGVGYLGPGHVTMKKSPEKVLYNLAGTGEFVIPRLPVQSSVRPTQSELKSPMFLSPSRSPAMFSRFAAHNIGTPYILNRPIVGLPQSSETKLQQPVRNLESTVMSTDDARSKILQLLPKFKVLVLLRGCPGSGKTTLAREIKFNGAIFSADDFFVCDGKYNYDVTKIADAHAWNKQQAWNAMIRGISPVIIDNTNTQMWEMLPYVEMAIQFNYYVEVIEPDVSWRLKTNQLAKHSIHGVSAQKMRSIVDRYEHNVTSKKLVDVVLAKKKPADPVPSANYASASVPKVVPILNQDVENKTPECLETPKSARKRRNRKKKKVADEGEEKQMDDEVLKDYGWTNEGNTAQLSWSDSVKEYVEDLQKPQTSNSFVDGGSQVSQLNLAELAPGADTVVDSKLDLAKEKMLLLEKLNSMKNICSGQKQHLSADKSYMSQTVGVSIHGGEELAYAAAAVSPDNQKEEMHSSAIKLDVEETPNLENLEELEKEIDEGSQRESLELYPRTDPSEEIFEEDSDFSVHGFDIVLSSLLAVDDEPSKTIPSCGAAANKEASSEASQTVEHTCDGIVNMPSTTEMEYWSRKDDSNDNKYSIHSLEDVCSPVAEDSFRSEESSSSHFNTTVKSVTSCSDLQAKPQRQLNRREISAETCNGKSEVPAVNRSTNFTSCISELQTHETEDASTQVEAKDFSAVYKLENGDSFDASRFLQVRSATPRVIFDRELAYQSQMELNSKILLISMSNESTMTDATETTEFEAMMEFLSGCFPTVIWDDLHDILNRCGNDTDLTANILLDSGYEYNKPNSARMRVSSSSNELGSAAAIESSPATVLASRQRASPVRWSKMPISYGRCHNTVKPNVMSSISDSNLLNNGTRTKAKANFTAQNKSLCLLQERVGETVTVSLPPVFAAQLIELFGPLDSCSNSDFLSDNDLNVELGIDTAKQIYDSWVATRFNIAQAHSAPNKSSEHLLKENSSVTMDQKQTGSSSALSGSWKTSDSCFLNNRNTRVSNKLELTKVMPKSPNTKFGHCSKYIQPNVDPDLEANSLSTKIKRQQLQERYPMINSTILDEIFEATGYSYDITVKTIQASPELTAPPKTVMTKRKAEELELELISRAIEENLKDHLDRNRTKETDFSSGNEVYGDLMSEACLYFNHYHENLKQAKEAHRKKMHQVAMHYSERANHFKGKLKETQQVAAEMIMQSRISDLSKLGSLDLHGFSVQEAIHLLKTSLSQREEELLERPDKRQSSFFLITGKGSHSHRGVARIKPAVEAYLKRNNYTFSEATPGILRVRLHVGF